MKLAYKVSPETHLVAYANIVQALLHNACPTFVSSDGTNRYEFRSHCSGTVTIEAKRASDGDYNLLSWQVD